MVVGAAVGILACDVPDPMTGSHAEPDLSEPLSDLNLDEPGDPPLIYVDGVRVDQSVLDRFTPDGIERVEVIKGEAAEAAYGPEASAGVVVRAAQGLRHLVQANAAPDPAVMIEEVAAVLRPIRQGWDEMASR